MFDFGIATIDVYGTPFPTTEVGFHNDDVAFLDLNPSTKNWDVSFDANQNDLDALLPND